MKCSYYRKLRKGFQSIESNEGFISFDEQIQFCYDVYMHVSFDREKIWDL